MHAQDLLLAVRREANVDATQRLTSERELRNRLEIARELLFSGNLAGGGSELLNGALEHLRRVPHADPRDQARALRGLAKMSELTSPADAISMYREALELYPRITEVKGRLKELEAKISARRPGRNVNGHERAGKK